jgi:hypothetical protein
MAPVQLQQVRVDCRQCVNNGWGVCRVWGISLQNDSARHCARFATVLNMSPEELIP